MERRVDTEQMQIMASRFVEATQGTCMSEDEVFEREEIPENLRDEVDFWHEVENWIFLCTQCNWWCESSEHSIHETHDFVCNQCLPDDEDD